MQAQSCRFPEYAKLSLFSYRLAAPFRLPLWRRPAGSASHAFATHRLLRHTPVHNVEKSLGDHVPISRCKSRLSESLAPCLSGTQDCALWPLDPIHVEPHASHYTSIRSGFCSLFWASGSLSYFLNFRSSSYILNFFYQLPFTPILEQLLFLSSSFILF